MPVQAQPRAKLIVAAFTALISEVLFLVYTNTFLMIPCSSITVIIFLSKVPQVETEVLQLAAAATVYNSNQP